jgi:hypothetical protein
LLEKKRKGIDKQYAEDFGVSGIIPSGSFLVFEKAHKDVSVAEW